MVGLVHTKTQRREGKAGAVGEGGVDQRGAVGKGIHHQGTKGRSGGGRVERRGGWICGCRAGLDWDGPGGESRPERRLNLSFLGGLVSWWFTNLMGFWVRSAGDERDRAEQSGVWAWAGVYAD